MYFLVEHCDWWYILAKVLAAVVVLAWNFFISKKFIFNTTKKRKIKVVIAAEIFPPDIGGPATYSHRLVMEF